MSNKKMIKGKHGEITGDIIASFYEVYNTLGYGFRELVYENAMIINLQDKGYRVAQQKELLVYYRNIVVGKFYADLVVNNIIIVELKATPDMLDHHIAQLLNYLRASTIEVGLVMNFGVRPRFQRKAMDNDQKGSLSWLKTAPNPRSSSQSASKEV